MKRLIKRAVGALGGHVFSDASLPTGVDWLLDIRRGGFVGARPLCLDVGANVGQTVLELRRHLPGCVIHAFEPFAAPYAELAALCAGLEGVTPVAVAIGEHAGSLQVRPREQSVLNSLVPHATDAAGAAPETIRIDTIDRYCAEHSIERVDVLKTDTEGYDLHVLKGATGMLRAQRIGVVYAEVTFDATNRQNTPFQPLFDRLTAFDYCFLGLYETYPLHRFEEPNLFCNALFVSRATRQAALLRRTAA